MVNLLGRIPFAGHFGVRWILFGTSINLGSVMRKILCSLLVIGFSSMPNAQSLTDCQTGAEAMKKEDYRAAIAPLTKCASLPLPARALSEVLQARAQSLSEVGRHQEALEDQKKSLSLAKPGTVWPLVMLAVYHRSLKQYSESLAALAEAQNYDEDGPGTGPGMAVGYHTGWTLQEKGEHARAIETFTSAIPKQPDYGWVFFRRALSYEAIGDQPHAREDLAKAYELVDPEGYDAVLLEKFKQYGYTPKLKKN